MREGIVESKEAIITGPQQEIGFQIARIHMQKCAFAVLEDFKKDHAVNLEETFLGCPFAIQPMKKHGESIINISSRSTNVGVPTMCGYAASKINVRNLTKSVELQYYSQNYPIRCNSIYAGAIDTLYWDPMEAGQNEELKRKKIASKIPFCRLGKPIRLARAVSIFDQKSRNLSPALN